MKKIWIIGLVVVVLIGGGAFAAIQFLGPKEDDAIELAPQDSFFYASLFLDPSSSQKMALEDLLAHFPEAGTPEEAESRLDELLTDAFESSPLDYVEDVKPWVGDQIAFFAVAPEEMEAGETPPVAALVATEDTDATSEAIDKAREEGDEDIEDRSYEGVDYGVNVDQESAYAIVESFLVLGTEDGVKATIDASQGDSLADSERYEDAVAELTPDRIALFYLDPRGIYESFQQSGSIPPIFAGNPLFDPEQQQPSAGALFLRSDAVVFEQASRMPEEGSPFADFVESSLRSGELVAELPSESWGAIGLGDVGSLVESVMGLAIPEPFRAQFEQEFTRQTGLDLQEDLLSWMGLTAAFVQGDDPASIGGGLVIESTDPAKSSVAIARIAEALEPILRQQGGDVRPLGGDPRAGFSIISPPAEPAFPTLRPKPKDEELPPSFPPVNVVAASDRVVIVIGEEATEAATGGGETLSSNPDFQSASEALGDGYSTALYFDADAIVNLIVAAGAPMPEEVAAWVEPLDFLSAGQKLEGDVAVSRVVIGVE